MGEDYSACVIDNPQVSYLVIADNIICFPDRRQGYEDKDRPIKKNFNYIKEELMILELMKNIKNQYVKANLEQKAKILKALLSSCKLQGVNTSFYWNKPFDILFEMGKTQRWGERGVSNPQPLDPQSSALTS